jgi:glycyl-tRNA synthetase
MKNMDEIAAFCRRRGIAFQNSEIYGGMAGFWDFGPVGVEIKNNIKSEWWRTFVRERDDVVGIDGATITHPAVWKASGHVESFTDPLVDCRKCKTRFRADHIIEDALKIPAEGFGLKKASAIIKKRNLCCPKCGGELTGARTYNLMFRTHIGPVEDETSVAYLRPETAQLIFTNFKEVLDSTRIKLPFGIAQIGRAYRNEISPRNFLFRSREFEQMEIEFFVHPEKADECSLIKEAENVTLNVLSAEAQQKGKHEAVPMKLKDALKKKIVKTAWHGYWLALQYKWFLDLGISPKNLLRVRQHLEDERSHYALDTWDIEYNFPFGWREIQGISDRTQFDLQQHIKHSKAKLQYFDEETKTNVIPYVAAEPSQGVERALLAFLVDAYSERDGKVVLKIHPRLAATKACVFPLVSKDGLPEKAREVHNSLRCCFPCTYDEKGSIGRRYARADEIGTPYCVTVDHQTLEDGTVTLRDRDDATQVRVKISELSNEIWKRVYCC